MGTDDPIGFPPCSASHKRIFFPPRKHVHANGFTRRKTNEKQEKGGSGFDDYGGELELYDLNITRGPDGASPSRLGSVKTPGRFGCIAWGGAGSTLDGTVVAGGMLDGTVNLWRPSGLLDGNSRDDALLSTVNLAGGGVTSIGFNPHGCSSHLLAAGTSTGAVRLVDLTSPSGPAVGSPGESDAAATMAGEVTQAAWNSQVPHILASSSSSGAVVVWDIRQRKPWCELRAESGAGGGVTDMAWNPTQGLHMMTGSGSGQLRLWDLRASTSMPLTSIDGHPGGVLGIDWCPHDDTLLVSCGNDNATRLWDLYSLRPVGELPNDDDSGGVGGGPAAGGGTAGDLYGGGLGMSQNKRYGVRWSPIRRGVLATCSFDRRVQAHSVAGLATRSGRPPKWMSPSSGVSTGFGGSVVKISGGTEGRRVVTVETVAEEPALAAASEQFEDDFAGGSGGGTECIAHCGAMAEKSADPYERQVWSFMQIMFETNAREELLNYLGFDPERIHAAAAEFAEGDNGDNGAVSSAGGGVPPMSASAERAVKDALLVGNFEAAVECCFRAGQLADALILASCGGADLWAKAQAEYFRRESRRRPFLGLVSAVIHDQLTELVSSSDPAEWRETLAVVSTYGKSDEFPGLCAALGDRLEGAGDPANASLCYMCALSLGRAVGFWRATLENRKSGGNPTNDLLALQDFVEKVTVFSKTVDSYELEDDVADLFAEYAGALASQGMLVAAAKYLRGTTRDCKELRDRIYRSRVGRYCPDLVSNPPDFPYDFVNVGAARDLTGITLKQQPTVASAQHLQVQSAQGGGVAHQPASQESAQHQHYQQQPAQQVQQSVQPHASPQQQPQLPASVPATPTLPPGWVALQDPSSGRTYYANQSTGESAWELPTAAPAPAQQQQPEPAATAASGGYAHSASNGYGQVQSTSSTAQPSPARQSATSTSQRVASKYGDGFVTSASNPELAEQVS